MNRHAKKIFSNSSHLSKTNLAWDDLTRDFESAYAAMPQKFMQREELSFHQFVKILGPACIEVQELPGDVVEIGVWKGKSLALMERLSSPSSKVIGVDPCALQGQSQELAYFHQQLFPRATIIELYSQLAIREVLNISRSFKILHIDGDHSADSVWIDFLLYERFVVPGGFIIFDDYADHEFSPEVGPAVDSMFELGLFQDYNVIGPVDNSYVLSRRI